MACLRESTIEFPFSQCTPSFLLCLFSEDTGQVGCFLGPVLGLGQRVLRAEGPRGIPVLGKGCHLKCLYL